MLLIRQICVQHKSDKCVPIENKRKDAIYNKNKYNRQLTDRKMSAKAKC